MPLSGSSEEVGVCRIRAICLFLSGDQAIEVARLIEVDRRSIRYLCQHRL